MSNWTWGMWEWEGREQELWTEHKGCLLWGKPRANIEGAKNDKKVRQNSSKSWQIKKKKSWRREENESYVCEDDQECVTRGTPCCEENSPRICFCRSNGQTALLPEIFATSEGASSPKTSRTMAGTPWQGSVLRRFATAAVFWPPKMWLWSPSLLTRLIWPLVISCCFREWIAATTDYFRGLPWYLGTFSVRPTRDSSAIALDSSAIALYRGAIALDAVP